MQLNASRGLMRPDESAPKIVAVIGDVMIDRYVSGTVNRISPEAPVPILLHRGDRAVAGGAANVAANVTALGCEVRLVGTVGADPDASDLRDQLAGAGVSSEFLVEDSDRPTTSKTRVVSGRQQFFRIDREQAGFPSTEVQTKLVAQAQLAITRADIVVLSDYAKGVLSDHVLAQVIGAAKAAGKLVLVDPKRRTFEAYRGADFIKPNAGELSAASGLACGTNFEVEAAAQALTDQFDGAVLVTRAEAGMSLFRPGFPVRHFETPVLEVADVSGAGDTALAALAVSLAEGRTIEEAAILSNMAAGIAVGKLGTAIVTRAELSAAVTRAAATSYHPGSLVNAAAAAEMASAWRRMGERVTFTKGDRLIVGLNSDASVRRLKGPLRPIQNEADRARIVGALRTVDLVVLFDEPTPLALIDAIAPDVLVKGADYAENQVVGGDLVKSRGGRVALVPLVADRSSTRIVEKMKS